MTDHAAVIAGGGPTGLMLAGELALAGVDAVIVERREDQELDGSRAGGLHARTLEVLDQRGIVDRFIDAGQIAQVTGFAMNMLDISDFPTRHAYGLILPQKQFEPILAAWVAELGVTTIRGRDVVGLAQDDTGVDVELSDGTSLRAGYLVGCDGGRSVVRRAAGIDFPGLAPMTSWIIAEVTMDGEPELGPRRDHRGLHGLHQMGGGGPVRVLLIEPDVEQTGTPTLDELRDALIGVYGSDFGLRDASWISRFTDSARQAETYRKGRVLLAGDAAHIHPPAGGQGLNIGVQDAVNLGWKLAQVINGTSPDSLLDTYHEERHPVGARVLRNTSAQIEISRPDERHDALREVVTEMLSTDGARKQVAAMISGLDVQYDLGEGHPLLGRRMPDLDIQTDDGPTRVFELLHDARPVLINLGEAGGFDVAPWTDRVRLLEAKHTGTWELPVIGDVPAPQAVLIRPDGYVAWTGELGDPELGDALARDGSTCP